MKRAPRPRGPAGRRIAQLLLETRDARSVGHRIDILSRHLLGRPYKSYPLIGSADKAEEFTASIDGFDCVTFIETILALACACGIDDFPERLRRLRYEGGVIEWNRRNHYMTNWIRNNRREGIIRPVSVATIPTVDKQRILNVVPGLAPQRTHVRCVPKAAAKRLKSLLQTADMIFFVSTRKNLDVFHTGIIVRDGERILMRHASRSKGSVVEQELSEFLRANRMAGIIVVRPQCGTQTAS